MTQHYKVSWHTIPWQTSVAGMRAKVYRYDRHQLRLVEFAHSFVEAEWCTKEHVGHVLDGSLEINIDGAVTLFEAGDSLYIPAGNQHKHAQTLSETATLILVEPIV